MPIFGKYDEYGRIEDIVEDATTKLIESVTGKTISEVINIIDDYCYGRWDCKELYQEIIASLSPVIGPSFRPSESVQIVFLLDHKFLFEECVASETALTMDEMTEGLANTRLVQKHLKEKALRNEQIIQSMPEEARNAVRKMMENNEDRYRFPYELNGEPYHLNERNFLNLDPNIIAGMFDDPSVQDYYLLEVYHGANVKALLSEENMEAYRQFICFYTYFRRHSWVFNMHNYCNQDDRIVELLPLYTRMVEFIQSKRK